MRVYMFMYMYCSSLEDFQEEFADISKEDQVSGWNCYNVHVIMIFFAGQKTS